MKIEEVNNTLNMVEAELASLGKRRNALEASMEPLRREMDDVLAKMDELRGVAQPLRSLAYSMTHSRGKSAEVEPLTTATQ